MPVVDIVVEQMLWMSSTAILFDVIRNVRFITKAENEMLIRQGDQGDW